jgi:hypothetical protein
MYEPWLDSLNDVLVPHIFNGLQVAYNSVAKICRNNKVLMAFQVTLENIKDLSQQSIDNDYRVLLKSIDEKGMDEEALRRIIKSLYRSYAAYAVTSAGHDGSKIGDIAIPARLSDFVKDAYVNTAREIWLKPYLFSNDYRGAEKQAHNNEIFAIIRASVLKTVRDGINLNALIAKMEGTPISTELNSTRTTATRSTLADRLRQIDRDTLMNASSFGIPAAAGLTAETLGKLPVVNASDVISKYNNFLKAPSEVSDVQTVSDMASVTEYTIPSELEDSESDNDTVELAKEIASAPTEPSQAPEATQEFDDIATIYEEEQEPADDLKTINTAASTSRTKASVMQTADAPVDLETNGTIRNKSTPSVRTSNRTSTMNIKLLPSSRGTNPFQDLEVNLITPSEDISSRFKLLGLE